MIRLSGGMFIRKCCVVCITKNAEKCGVSIRFVTAWCVRKCCGVFITENADRSLGLLLRVH